MISLYTKNIYKKEKNRFAIDKNRPYEYNVAIIVLGEPCNEGIIDIFDMAEALIKLRKLYNLPATDISASVCLRQLITMNGLYDKHEPCIVFCKRNI